MLKQLTELEQQVRQGLLMVLLSIITAKVLLVFAIEQAKLEAGVEEEMVAFRVELELGVELEQVQLLL